MIHILNGDAINYAFDLNKISGQRIVFREMLCDGPSQYKFNSSFWEIRKNFLINDLNVPEEDLDAKSFHHSIDEIEAGNEIVLWFEYDLFCQVNLCAALSYLKQLNINENLYLVCVGDFPDSEKRLGLGEIDPNLYPELLKKKRSIFKEDLELADQFWKIWTSHSHEALKDLKITKTFTYLYDAIHYHFRRFRNHENKNEIDLRIKQGINEGNETVDDMISYLLNLDNDFGFGDFQYARYLKKLQEVGIISIDDAKITYKTDYQDIEIPEVFGGFKNSKNKL